MTKRIGTQGTDDFETNLVSSFKGYNSSIDPTNAPANILVRGSYNVYKKLSGTIANRPGLKTRGSSDDTLAGTKSSWEWNTWDARILPLRINNNKLQVESDIVTSGTFVWYTLLSSLASSFDNTVFDAWWDNTNKKDVLLFVGGTSTLYHWSGAMALISSTTANTIVLDRDATTAGFSATGSVLINGNTYTYSGISTNTLTGVSGDPTGEANNSVVMEATGSNATTPASGFTNDFIKVINNQLFVGSYTSRNVYISKTTSYTDYTQSTPRIPGDGGKITMDDIGKGIGVRQGNPWLSAGTSDWYEITFPQITVGSTLSENINVSKKPTSVLSAPLRHEFIGNIGEELIVLCQDQQVRMIGQFRNQFTTKYPSLSLAVKTEFEEEDFTGGHLRCIGDFIHITAPLAGRDYMHETRETIDINGNITAERFWHPPQIRNVSRFAVIDGVIYGHSNANPMIYQIWNTGQWHDDSPTDNLPYKAVMLMSYQNGGRRQGLINFDKLFVEGYAANANLYSAIYYDYQGSTLVQNPNLNIPEDPFPKTFLGIIPPSLGDFSLGDVPLGDGLATANDDQEMLPKFKVIAGYEPENCYEYAIMIYSENIDARWEVLALGVNVSLAEAQAVEIIKSK